MDYKYIEQLLERYWQCETSLKEEEILRAFFSQEEVPAELQAYQALFSVGSEPQGLGEDFDARVLSMIGDDEPPTVKARTVSLTQRMMPLFKAAAIVAIILTLGNAAQAPWDGGWDDPKDMYASHEQADTAAIQQGPIQAENVLEDSTQTPAQVAPVVPKY